MMKKQTIKLGIAVFFLVYALAVFVSMGDDVAALGNSTNGSMIVIGPGTGLATVNLSPMVFLDTDIVFNPYVTTENTTNLYGMNYTSVHNDSGWRIPIRQDYMFTGETMTFYAIVMDGNGIADINNVALYVKNSTDFIYVADCVNRTDFTDVTGFSLVDYNGDAIAYDPAIMRSYVCNLTPDNSLMGEYEIVINADDSFGFAGNATFEDNFAINPSISIGLSGMIDFGMVAENSIAMSNTIYLENIDIGDYVGDSAVVLDMYISSDEYFDDPFDSGSACPTTAGLPYSRISYFATKGSMDSGINNNEYPGLGENSTSLCVADVSGFTPLVNTTGSQLSKMCRIINWDYKASLLAQGADMSLTFSIDVPSPCIGTFTDGQFYFIGEVI